MDPFWKWVNRPTLSGVPVSSVSGAPRKPFGPPRLSYFFPISPYTLNAATREVAPAIASTNRPRLFDLIFLLAIVSSDLVTLTTLSRAGKMTEQIYRVRIESCTQSEQRE